MDKKKMQQLMKAEAMRKEGYKPEENTDKPKLDNGTLSLMGDLGMDIGDVDKKELEENMDSPTPKLDEGTVDMMRDILGKGSPDTVEEVPEEAEILEEDSVAEDLVRHTGVVEGKTHHYKDETDIDLLINEYVETTDTEDSLCVREVVDSLNKDKPVAITIEGRSLPIKGIYDFQGSIYLETGEVPEDMFVSAEKIVKDLSEYKEDTRILIDNKRKYLVITEVSEGSSRFAIKVE